MRGAIEQWRDAAEFEARVTEKMAGGEPFCPPPSEPVKWLPILEKRIPPETNR